MADNFITIRDAITLTGRADITIRRLIKQMIKQNNPETMQMIKQKQTGTGFIYEINKDYLFRELEISEPIKEQQQPEPIKPPEPAQDSEVITLLKETTGLLKDQLIKKDEQIKDLGGKIDQLIERDRETNIILKGLQDKVLMLEQPKKPIWKRVFNKQDKQ